jgi:hypothetical protein
MACYRDNIFKSKTWSNGRMTGIIDEGRNVFGKNLTEIQITHSRESFFQFLGSNIPAQHKIPAATECLFRF